MNNNYQNGRRSEAPVRSQSSNLPQRKGGAVVQLHGRALRQKQKDEQWKREEKQLERVRHGVDRPMLIILFVILILGSIMVFSASFPSAHASEKTGHDSFYFIKKHLLYAGGGCAAMLGMSFLPINFYKKFTPALYLFSSALLGIVFIIGTAQGVAKRWIFLGPISFQPSELGKAAVILMLAWYFDRAYKRVNNPIDRKNAIIDGVAIPGVIMGFICALVLFERHLSGAIIIALIGVCVIFLGGANVIYAAVTYGICGLAAGGIFLMLNPYALQRILTHTNENADVLTDAWQTTQGIYAIGSGGVLGVGLGDSRLKYNYVSEPQNDFIFTIWCEEMGLIGAVIVVALYLLFIWRGFVIAKKAPDTYSSLVAFGITCQVGIQAFLNMMVVTDLIPNTGISLPFFSYGGSAILILLCEMGILLSISRHSYQKK